MRLRLLFYSFVYRVLLSSAVLVVLFADIFGVETCNLFGVNRNLLQCARTFVGACAAFENFVNNLFTVFLSHTNSVGIIENYIRNTARQKFEPFQPQSFNP